MRVVVMGCGRVGAALSVELDAAGHQVVVIDRDSAAFARLWAEFSGRTVTGQGFDQTVLTDAGLEGADAFAAVSSGDNSNIIAARVARETFGVERVIARIYDAGRAEVYERLGISTIATVPWATGRLVRYITAGSSPVEWRDRPGSYQLASSAGRSTPIASSMVPRISALYAASICIVAPVSDTDRPLRP